jgi:hypothetical protein
MTRDSAAVPIACRLSDAELRKRETTLLAQFKSAVLSRVELPDGYAFRILGDKKAMELVCELILAERECCPFLTFELTAQPNRGPVNLRATGPDGAKEFLKTLLCNFESSF